MSGEFSSQKKGISSDPSESNSNAGNPERPPSKQTNQEGDFRNAESKGDSREDFDEAYEVKREEEISEEEAGSENDDDQ